MAVLPWHFPGFALKIHFFKEKKQKKTEICLVIMIFVIFVHR